MKQLLTFLSLAVLSLNVQAQSYIIKGKELDRMHGLDWYDYGARHYDAAFVSWPTMDPLCEKYYSISPYVYCGDNPIKFVDIEGKAVYLFATTLPGADWVPFTTHTFLVVTNTDGILRGYYSFGEESMWKCLTTL